MDGEPRIANPGGRDQRDGNESSISITPYMMAAGEEKIVADRLYALLSKPTKQAPETPAAPAADLSGQWDVQIEYLAGRSKHTLHLKQQGNRIEGSHQGDFVSRDLSGSIDGDNVQLSSRYTERHGDSLMFTFSGKAGANEMSGSLDMGEYLNAKWTAKRHDYRRG
jgi:L-seryl-tRNA(Ser) seleniumtransferase